MEGAYRRKKPGASFDGILPESALERNLKTILAEVERKLAALTTQFEEKVEQNITLQQQADIDLRLILDLQEENKKLLSLLQEQKALSSEYQRRNESMAVGLNMMASEILQLRAELDLKDGKKGKANAPSLPIIDSEQEMIMLQKISDLTHDNKKLKKKYHEVKQSEGSLLENVDMYEEELRKKKRTWKDAIQKESKRRKNAENEIRRLKGKVEELEFLLDERENSNDLSSSDESMEGADVVDMTDESNQVTTKVSPDDAPTADVSATHEVTPSQDSPEIPDAPAIKHSRVLPPLVTDIQNHATSVEQEPAVDDQKSHAVALPVAVVVPVSVAIEPADAEISVANDGFEDKLKKRVEERQRIIESRTKRLELEESFERLRRHSETTSAPIPNLSPRSESISSTPTIENNATIEKTPTEVPKKPSFLDKIAAVFKPNNAD